MKLCTQSLFPQWFLVAFFTNGQPAIVGPSIATVCHHDITSSSHLYSGYGPMLFIQTRALLKQKRSTEALPRSSRTFVLFLRKGMLT